MSPYLNFSIGNREDTRGRAFLFIEDKDKQEVHALKTIDIDGIALKEALYNEIKEGRLILPDIFEPFFVVTGNRDISLSYSEMQELAKQEQRDLVFVSIENEKEAAHPEIAMEKGIARYTTLFRENITLRLLRQTTNEIFHRKRRIPTQPIYVATFKLAELICLLTRSRREGNRMEVEYFSKLMEDLQKNIPQINLQKIIPLLAEGDGCQWQEIAEYVDVFYLTLKENYPFPLEFDVFLNVKAESLEWLKEEPMSLYHEYFVALLQEKYEKALELKQAIDTYHSSQSLEGCR